MTPNQFGYAAMIVGALIVILSMALSYIWHKRDAAMPDPRDNGQPWSPDEWAVYHNCLRAQRALQYVGVLLLYVGSVVSVLGLLIVGVIGLRS